MLRLLIGTSGWHYDLWRGPFFPKGLPIKNQLQYYASQFSTTELNGVFYRIPSPEAVQNWREQTGKDFVFAWKASKYITHWKRLSPDLESSLALQEDRVSLLGDKLDQFCFNCRQILKSMPTGSFHFSSCCRKNAATFSNFAIPAGMCPASWHCSPNGTFHCVFQITTMRRHHGNALRILSMCAVMDQADDTKGIRSPRVCGLGEAHQVLERSGLRRLRLFR